MSTPPPAGPLALAHWIEPKRAAALESELGTGEAQELAILLGTAFPPLKPVQSWQVDLLARLAADGYRGHPDRQAVLARIRKSIGELDDGDRVAAELRRQAWLQKARIALRELLPASYGGADIELTALELSDLADATLEVALEEARAAARRRYGEPLRADGTPSTLVIFGMGKLGGHELNAGSDIDLIAIYDTDDGGSAVSLHEHWTFVMRRAVATIDRPTGEGMVWRVDLRLRPEGSRGPLVYSCVAAERYYETWGRTWERASLLRARPVAGDLALGETFRREVIAPFVYSHRVDPSMATALAEMVERSRAELSVDPSRDLKLGSGGIREAEFFVQALQLIWGGRNASLRVQGSLAALRRLHTAGLVTDREARTITDAYLLLRRVEHAVQWRSGMQTHLLPTDSAEIEILGRMLGFADGTAFMSELSAARDSVRDLFASLLPEAPRPAPRHTVLLSRLETDGEELAAAVESVFGELDVAEHLAALARRPDGLLGELTRERYPDVADSVLQALSSCSDPEQAVRYLRSLYGRFYSPMPYIAPLARDPRALSRLVTVLGASAFVGDAVVARPDLADILIFGSGQLTPQQAHAVVQQEIESYEEQLRADADVHEARDEFIGALRRAKGKLMVEVAVADLAGEIDTRDVTRILSELADEIIDRAVRFELAGDPRGLAVIAVGKLGGMEIGYGSDLDVLFVYDAAAAPAGQDPADYFMRRAQRIIRLISAPHVAGVGYELDTRLRPSGSHGLLVTSLSAFARYHRVRLDEHPESEKPAVFSSGAAWERQALLRARACAGDHDVGRETIRIAHIAAYERGAPPAEELHYLRMRMERELGRERPGRYDIKLGYGGLLDVEFATQWLQMRHGQDQRVRTTDTLRALEALTAGGYIEEKHFEPLHSGYQFLRRLEQRLRVLHDSGSTVIEASAPGLVKLARRLGIERRPYATEAELLLEAYRGVTKNIRQSYLAVLGL